MVPTGRNRDSGPLERSNFEHATAVLGDDDDVEIHRFGHWAVGWLEIILVRPGSEAAARAARIEERLGNHTVLDEEAMTGEEIGVYDESWRLWGAREFAQALAKAQGLPEEDAEALEDADKEKLREMYEAGIPSGDYMDIDSRRIAAAVAATSPEVVEELVGATRNVAPAP